MGLVERLRSLGDSQRVVLNVGNTFAVGLLVAGGGVSFVRFLRDGF